MYDSTVATRPALDPATRPADLDWTQAPAPVPTRTARALLWTEAPDWDDVLPARPAPRTIRARIAAQLRAAFTR